MVMFSLTEKTKGNLKNSRGRFRTLVRYLLLMPGDNGTSN